MGIKVTLKTRDGVVRAEAIYEENTFTILPGGKISKTMATYVKGGKKAKAYRNNPQFVDANQNILRECVFKSPSSAAEFVLGASSNGYRSWKVNNKKTLGEYLKEIGER